MTNMGRAGHAGEMLEQALHAGKGAGKRERLAVGPCGDGVGWRRSVVRGLEQLRRTPHPKWGIFLFLEAGPLIAQEGGRIGSCVPRFF